MANNEYGIVKLDKDMYKVGDCWVVKDKELGQIIFQPDLPYSKDIAACMGSLLREDPNRAIKIKYYLDKDWHTLGLELGTSVKKAGFWRPSPYWQHKLFGTNGVLSPNDMKELKSPDNWFQSFTTWVQGFFGDWHLLTGGKMNGKSIKLTHATSIDGCTSGEELMRVLEKLDKYMDARKMGCNLSAVTPVRISAPKRLDLISPEQTPLSEIKVLPCKIHPIRQKLPESVLQVAATKGFRCISRGLKI